MRKKILNHLFSISLFIIFGITATNSTYAMTFSVPATGNVIGQIQKVKAKRGDTLFKLAQKYDIGIKEIMAHNPKRGLGSQLAAGTVVTIPTRYTLPSGPRSGVVLNLAQMRLFHYNADGTQVDTYPVGIGRPGWSTPQGETTVVSKSKNPSWTPPPSIRREALRSNRTLPKSIPPGPRNPLGRYAIHLGMSGILIHGTPQQTSIGQRCSHGCIRMFTKNIEELFNTIQIGTPVRIIHEKFEASR